MKKLILSIFILCFAIQAFPQKYVKVWSDEFNKPGLPDSTKWDYEVGKIRNAELQYYTYKRSENARIQDTVLIIEARKEPFQGASYTSASLVSRYKGDWLYGKFEIRAKVPTGKGTWPAIWMMPTDSEYGGWPKSGEMDIMEYVGMNANNLYYTAHFEGTNGSGHQSSGTQTTYNQPYSKFITFTFVWSPTKLEWYADGVKKYTYNKPSGDYRVWPFDKMFYMILNLAYGGSWGDQKGHDDTKLPHKFLIDYVRVYQLQETEGPFSLTIEPSTGGTVEFAPKMESYPEGTMVTLTAQPENGYEFDKWLYLGSANPMTIEVSKNMTLIPVFKKKNELILNGDFSSGLKNWGNLYFHIASYKATASVVDGVYVLNVTSPGTANWHIVDQQLNIPFINAANYKITFDAWSDNPGIADVFISKNYDDYGNYYSTTRSITGVKQTFIWIVKMNKPTDYNCRFGFVFGKFTGNVYLDNVSVEKQVPTGNKVLTGIENEEFSLFPNPTSGEITISGNSVSSPVTLILCNLQGQLISTILNNQYLTKGNTVTFNLRNEVASSGIYMLRLTNKDNSFTRKVILN
ncbi:MAG: family 16 glycosylhydrolase [Bacteroidota bacterium]|nr:family 16 glycosylhydrolase [Bacteroidota bacterium]